MVTDAIVGTIGKWQKYRRAAVSILSGASITEGYFYSPSLAKSIRELHSPQSF